MRWYLNRTGQGEGPFDEPTLVGMIGRGEATAVHQICPEGQKAWLAMNSHPAFAQALAGPAPQAPAAPAAGPATDIDAPPAAPGAAPAAPQAGFGAAPAAPQAGFGAAPASDLNQAANAVGNEVNAAANAVGNALAAPGGQQPELAAPGLAAPGEGFFDLARAEGTPPSDDAKAGAGMAHLLGAVGAFVSCGCFGGIAGAFLGSILYKEQPKSSFALYHINQAVLFQLMILGCNFAVGVLGAVLGVVLSMIHPLAGTAASLLYLVNLALWLAGVILPFLHSGKAKKGEWSEYPVIGKKVLGLKGPILK